MTHFNEVFIGINHSKILRQVHDKITRVRNGFVVWVMCKALLVCRWNISNQTPIFVGIFIIYVVPWHFVCHHFHSMCHNWLFLKVDCFHSRYRLYVAAVLYARDMILWCTLKTVQNISYLTVMWHKRQHTIIRHKWHILLHIYVERKQFCECWDSWLHFIGRKYLI